MLRIKSSVILCVNCLFPGALPDSHTIMPTIEFTTWPLERPVIRVAGLKAVSSMAIRLAETASLRSLLVSANPMMEEAGHRKSHKIDFNPSTCYNKQILVRSVVAALGPVLCPGQTS
jgi:hypothetical protein